LLLIFLEACKYECIEYLPISFSIGPMTTVNNRNVRILLSGVITHGVMTAYAITSESDAWILILLVYGGEFLIPTILFVYALNYLISITADYYPITRSMMGQIILCSLLEVILFTIGWAFSLLTEKEYVDTFIYVSMTSLILGVVNFLVVPKEV